MASLGQLSSYNNKQTDLRDYINSVNSTRGPEPLPKSTSLAQDMGLEFKQGMVNAGQSAIGMGDLATGGRATDYTQSRLGYSPQNDLAKLSSQMTPEQISAESNMSTGMQGGFSSTVKAAVENPRAVLGAAVRSLPLMGAGMAASAIAVAGGAGATGAILAGSLAEGAMTSGIHAQDSQASGIPYSKYAPNALGAGALTAAIGIGSGKLFGDAATNLLLGSKATRPVGVLKGIATEGGEEYAQSGQEKAFENRTNDRPLTEGVSGEATFGGIVGGLMGAGMSAASRSVVNPSTGKPTGKEDVVHPSTGDVITNKDIKTAYTTYTNAFNNVKDTTNEHYSSAMSAATELLHSVMNPTGTKVANPKDVEDAKAIMDLMTKTHSSLQDEETKAIIPEEASTPETPPVVDVPSTPEEEMLRPEVAPVNNSHLTPETSAADSSIKSDEPIAPEPIAPAADTPEVNTTSSAATQEGIDQLTEEDHTKIVDEMVKNPEESYSDIVDRYISNKLEGVKDEPVPTETAKVEEEIKQPELPTETNTIQKETANPSNIAPKEKLPATERTPEASTPRDGRPDVTPVDVVKEKIQKDLVKTPKEKRAKKLVDEVTALTSEIEAAKSVQVDPNVKVNVIADAKKASGLAKLRARADAAVAAAASETPTEVNAIAEAKVNRVEAIARANTKIKANLNNQSVPAKSSPEPVAIDNIQPATTIAPTEPIAHTVAPKPVKSSIASEPKTSKEVSTANKEPEAILPQPELDSDSIIKLLHTAVTTRDNMRFDKVGDSYNISIKGSHVATVPNAPKDGDSVIKDILLNYKNALDKEGKSVPTNIKDMSREHFVVANKFGKLVNDFEISGEDLKNSTGGIKNNPDGTFGIDHDALYDRIQASYKLTPEEAITKSVVKGIQSSQDKVISNEINDRPTDIKDFVEATTSNTDHTPEGLDSYISKLKTLSSIAKGNDDLSEIDTSILGKDTVSKEDIPKITELYQEAVAKRAELFSDPAKIKRLKKRVDTSLTSSELLDDDSYSEIDFNDDSSFDTSQNSKAAKPDHVLNILAINKLQRSLGKFMRKSGVTIHYQANWMDHTFPKGTKFDKIDHRRINAWIHSSQGKHNIYIHGNSFVDQKSLIGTIAHELIGHFGIAEVLGGDAKYKTYLNKLLNNKEILKDILALNKRWDVYLKSWNSVNDINSIPSKDIFIHNGIKIPRDIAIKLADEYMAELAKEKFFDNQFLERAVGLGVRNSPERSSIRAMRNNVLRDFIAKVRHFFKSIFGDHFDSYTYDDLVALVAKSIDNVFENLNADHVSYTSKQGFVKEGIPMSPVNPITGSFDIADTLPLDVQTSIPTETGLLDNIQGFVNNMESNFGNHTDTYRSKFMQKMNDKINNNPLLSSMTTFGNMPYQKAYVGVDSIFKGKMAVVEKNPGAVAEILNTINPLQNQLVFKYYTTKGADINEIPLTPIQKDVIVNSKAAIREIGESLYKLGAISKESYEKYDDAYLHLVYLEYLNQYKGSNKTPFMGWAKKRKDLDDGAKLALGMIKDVKFLVPETLGIMSRDHTLLAMFDTISKVSTEANTHWVMKDRIPLEYLGVKMDLDTALTQLEMNERIILQHEKVDKNTFGADDTMIERMKLDTKNLSDQITNSQAQMSKELELAFQNAKTKGHTKVATKEEFLKENYIQMPNTVKQGALRNKYVRKEIHKDLQSINSAYTFGDKSDMEKFFAEGGTMDRMNRFWKLSKVGLNPASWVRNIMGNFTLLDLSTSTNKLKLVGMLHEELSGLYSGKQSNYWRLAEKHGLFGVTFSAMELQLLHNTYAKGLTDSQKAFGSRASTPHSNSLHFLDERLMHFMEMGKDEATSAISKAGIATSKLYGLMEGAFKTVSFKDYIQTWESQNGVSLDSLSEEQQLIVTTKAAAHANDSIFDYSKVPSWVRFLRTTPLGMPFLTFTYKAFPASIKAMVNHPIKFAQYAALPSLLTMLAAGMNDWDDKDVKELNSKMSDYYRHNSGVAILPWKDSEGRAQLINLDFLFPWSQHVHAVRTLTDGYHDGGVLGSATSSADAARVLGILGGPLPQTITAMTTGINSFTGKPIMTPGANPTQQVTDLARYSWDLATPSWISSTGWFSKLYNTFKDKPSVDRFGDLKTTPTQAIMDITGVAPKPISEHGQQNRRLYYAGKIREINTYRSQVIKDRNNMEDRPGLLKDISVRLKMVRSQMSEEFR